MEAPGSRASFRPSGSDLELKPFEARLEAAKKLCHSDVLRLGTRFGGGNDEKIIENPSKSYGLA